MYMYYLTFIPRKSSEIHVNVIILWSYVKSITNYNHSSSFISIRKIIHIKLCNFQNHNTHNPKLNAALPNQYAVTNHQIFLTHAALYLILCKMNAKTFQNLISHILKKVNLKIWNWNQIIYRIFYLIRSKLFQISK